MGVRKKYEFVYIYICLYVEYSICLSAMMMCFLYVLLPLQRYFRDVFLEKFLVAQLQQILQSPRHRRPYILLATSALVIMKLIHWQSVSVTYLYLRSPLNVLGQLEQTLHVKSFLIGWDCSRVAQNKQEIWL